MGLLRITKGLSQFVGDFYKIKKPIIFSFELTLKLLLLICVLFLQTTSLHAEGTKTWQPDPNSKSDLYITSPSSNAIGVQSFAGYLSQPNMKMYVHIKDPANEMLYLGFSSSGYKFRIVSPTGAIVHGEHTVNDPNVNSHALATAGPDVLGNGGYSTNNAMFKFDPQGHPAGDYSIEFGRSINMQWFDVTVATKGANPQEIKGRLWSQAWQVNCGSFTDSLKAMFYARDDKGYVTQVNFAEAGIKPYVGQFSFNDTGTGSSGNVAEDRKSVPNAQSGNPVHKIFLNQPDPSVYPLGVDGEIQNLPLKINDPANPNVTIDVTQAGHIELVLDFGTIGDYSEAVDRRLYANVTAGVNTLPWDGKRGDGQKVQPQNYPIPVNISYTQGETHFTVYDVEYLDESFVVRTQTTAGLTTPNVLFWDDSRITHSPNLPPNQKVNTDVGSVARQPWSNSSYGDVNTINTWWFAFRDYLTATVLMPGDYGDAPASYGGAAHKIPQIPTVYLGAIAPDKELQMPTTLDGTGDDVDGSDDEDALDTLPELDTASTDYSLTIPCVGSGTVAAWVDFDQSGAFDDSERQAKVCDASGSVTLSWNSLSGLSSGTTYIRLRTASDANQVAKAVGGASDGEVEDYQIVIKIGGFPVKGRIYRDSNVDGVNDAGEEGISGLPVVLLDVANGTCISTRTNADGNYEFFPVIPGDYRLYEASRETVPTPQNCDVIKAKDLENYRSTTNNALAQFSVVDTEITGKDFGDINNPTFSPDHSDTVLPGNVVFYTHQFTSPSTGIVNFNTVNSGAATSGWSSVIYQDADCNGKLEGAEINTPVISDLATTAGQDICLINKVSSPSDVSAGETFANTISADFNFNNNVLAGTTLLKVTDLTKAAANDSLLGSSKLTLRKTVQNLTQSSAETETQNQAKSGDILQYRLYYSNTGTGLITDLEIKDVIPEFTTLLSTEDCSVVLPASLTTCSAVVNGSAIEWIFGAGDELKEGANGVVSYKVSID